ncbi:MAG TPA: hypothetical protein VGI29_12840 [Candidatus Binataceae bacterium]|jgi:hypothetical protein
MHLGAAIFGQKPKQGRGLAPVYRVVDKTAGAPRGKQAGARQRVEVVRQRRTRQLEPPLDFVNALALGPGTDEEAKDLQPILLAEGR